MSELLPAGRATAPKLPQISAQPVKLETELPSVDLDTIDAVLELPDLPRLHIVPRLYQPGELVDYGSYRTVEI